MKKIIGLVLFLFLVFLSTVNAASPINKDECKKNGWMTFTSPSFKNQGQCVSYVNHQNKTDDVVPTAFGDIYMGPGDTEQRIVLSVNDLGISSLDTGTVEYWNYDYPGILHYTSNISCVYINQATNESRFLFQIPAGWPGLSGLYVVSSVVDGFPDTYAHAATADLPTALSWCESGSAPMTSYSVTSGDLTVN